MKVINIKDKFEYLNGEAVYPLNHHSPVGILKTTISGIVRIHCFRNCENVESSKFTTNSGSLFTSIKLKNYLNKN
jgi:hypothetical protein